MSIRVAGRTDVGRVRDRNEDALLQQPARGVVAVADGMGGHAAGDIASRIAIDVVDDRTAHLPDSGLADYLRETVHVAHEAILKAASADPELEGMGTTLTALRLDPGSHQAMVAHVGDSRAYRWRSGTLEQITRDQTWVQEQVDAGRISVERARNHPFAAMLTCALGIPDIELDVQIIEPDAQPDDIFLVCSDGLTARLDDSDLREILLARPDIDDAADALVDAANEAGGPDNITVGLLHVLED